MTIRIIAGRHRGRRLAVPGGLEVRPTAERAREALMAILEHADPPLEGARFLDLFAGTGAVGLEAASRGAAEVLLVEQASAALASLRQNVQLLDEVGRVAIRQGDALRLGKAPRPFDIVFLDPPYRSPLAEPALRGLANGGWLAAEARIIVELAADQPLKPPSTYALEEERRYGRSRFVFLRPAATPADGSSPASAAPGP